MITFAKNLRAECIWNRKHTLWTCANGKRMYFTEMTDSHLLNTLRMVEEKHKGDFGKQIWAELRLTVQKRKLKPLKLRTPEQIVKDQREWEAGQKRELEQKLCNLSRQDWDLIDHDF